MTPANRLPGGVHIIGGGASLRGFDFNTLRGKHCIAVNCAGYDAPFADMLVFSDPPWFAAHEAMARAFAGIVASAAPWARKLGGNVNVYTASKGETFPTDGTIRFGRTSGHIAVSIAIAEGAKRIVLHGFDGCRQEDNETHYHGRYAVPASDEQLAKYCRSWAGWREAARRAGAEIRHARAGSAITEFECR